ncbi:hypothetical protein [Planomonospora sphaerica]|uniref:hypothetical protein n=1 Tax=Planomonospora sphaerica TaxID=161355 RepID=UPI00128FF352|nr:hypothetical protein [Planomonospora sphaerica]
MDDLTLPMDSYDLDNVRRARVQEARFKIIRECLKGFDLVMPEHDTGPIRYPRNAAYLGWLGEKEVHRHGYLGPAGQEAEEFAALDGLRMFDIPVDQDAAHTGLGASKVNGVRVPRGGCAGEAERALNAGAAGPDGSGPAKENDFKRLYSLMEDAATEGFRDERIREADARWSECMEKKGFSYGKPFDAQSDRRWQLGDSGRGRRSVSALEIKTAVADEQCRLQVDYSGVRRAAYTEAQNAIIEKNRGVLRNLKELMEKRYSNAVKILG